MARLFYLALPRWLTSTGYPVLRGAAVATLLGALLGACGKDDGSVTISGDVAGLDTIGLRGDALIANAGKLPSATDSLRVMTDLKLSRPRGATGAKGGATSTTSGDAAGTLSLPGVNPMTARAQARGDSMARAEAMRLVGRTAGSNSRGDSLRGVITLLGDYPAQHAALTVPGGDVISLSGMSTVAMTKLRGAEVMVHGVRISKRDWVVSDFVVRAANGAPALDGKLEGDPQSGWTLVLSDGSGRKRLASLPAALQGRTGVRVWIGAASKDAPGYGVIAR